mmetsp:Transcript_20135/g.80337  ORF Transcript_20135/g.80337 Transcript_20135/m.80337 type:complete len:207 (+) Transcript_20135:757-1377(+)
MNAPSPFCSPNQYHHRHHHMASWWCAPPRLPAVSSRAERIYPRSDSRCRRVVIARARCRVSYHPTPRRRSRSSPAAEPADGPTGVALLSSRRRAASTIDLSTAAAGPPPPAASRSLFFGFSMCCVDHVCVALVLRFPCVGDAWIVGWGVDRVRGASRVEEGRLDVCSHEPPAIRRREVVARRARRDAAFSLLSAAYLIGCVCLTDC